MWFWTDHVCSDTVTKKTRKCCWATIACPLQIVLNYTKSLHLHNIKDLLDWSCHSVTAGLPQGRTPELPKEINFQLTKGSHPPPPLHKDNNKTKTTTTYKQCLPTFRCSWSLFLVGYDPVWEAIAVQVLTHHSLVLHLGRTHHLQWLIFPFGLLHQLEVAHIKLGGCAVGDEAITSFRSLLGSLRALAWSFVCT